MTLRRQPPDRLYELLPGDVPDRRRRERRSAARAARAGHRPGRPDPRRHPPAVGRLLHRDLPALGHPLHRRPGRQHPAPSTSTSPRPRATAESLFTDLAGPDLAAANPVRLRADVAKTIYYRRRKGTPPMLEELARDVTGWDARVVEFFELLDWNQHLEHLRLDCHGCPDLRSVDAATRVDGPWDRGDAHRRRARRSPSGTAGTTSRTSASSCGGSAPSRAPTVAPAIGGSSWRLTFSPLGQDVPLFSAGDGAVPGTGAATSAPSTRHPRPAAFFADLGGRSYGAGTGRCTGLDIRAEARHVVDGRSPASDIVCANLENGCATSRSRPGPQIRIDPARGRLAVPTGRNGQQT